MRTLSAPFLSGLILLGLGVAAPFLLNDFWINILAQVLIFGVLALSIDLLLGHTGMFPMGHAAFFAMAAYTTAMLEVRHGIPSIGAAPAGILAAGILALIYGLSVRTKGVYFILLTLALGHIIWGISVSWSSFTGGDNGIGGIPFPSFGPFAITRFISYYYFLLATVSGVSLGYWILIRSPFGQSLRGIRESESRMRSLGYSVGMHKYIAFVISGLLAGVAGVLYVYCNRFVSPPTASFLVSAEAALMVILGGTGTLIGPFLGSAITLIIRNYVSAYLEQWMTVMGLIFIFTVLYAPQGIVGLIRRFTLRSARGGLNDLG